MHGDATTLAATNYTIGMKPGAVVDNGWEWPVKIGAEGVMMTNVTPHADSLLDTAIDEAIAAYGMANGGRTFDCDHFEELLPYFRDPVLRDRTYAAHQKYRAEIAAKTSPH